MLGRSVASVAYVHSAVVLVCYLNQLEAALLLLSGPQGHFQPWLSLTSPPRAPLTLPMAQDPISDPRAARLCPRDTNHSKDSLQHSKALPCPVMGRAGPAYRPMSPSWPWTVPFPVPSEMSTALPALLLAGVVRRTQVLAVRIWQSLTSARSIRRNIPNSQGYFFPLVYWFVKRFCERSGKIAVAQYSEIGEISKDNKGTTVQWSCTVSLVYKCCRLRNHHLSTPEYACQNWGCSSVFMIRWHQQEASGYLISPDTTVGACVPFKPLFWENVVTGWSFYVRSVLWGKTSSSLWTCMARFVAQKLGEMHALL